MAGGNDDYERLLMVPANGNISLNINYMFPIRSLDTPLILPYLQLLWVFTEKQNNNNRRKYIRRAREHEKNEEK